MGNAESMNSREASTLYGRCARTPDTLQPHRTLTLSKSLHVVNDQIGPHLPTCPSVATHAKADVVVLTQPRTTRLTRIAHLYPQIRRFRTSMTGTFC
ncbi:hypothetical protein L484_023354 [Morus notabilis]|uniref:Uncharacterized protein n=1 Tax=Morus notabilis TaxID=981085 RepID=W9SU57_9ROSA|nr:hypothetical protein L484_023354 [Morus notabilis]